MSKPTSHLQESQKLTADAIIDLFEIQLKVAPVFFRFVNGPTVTWQGKTYESMGCQLTGESRMSSAEEARPSLKLMNPEGIFNPYLFNGSMDFAIVSRKQVLKTHLDGNVNISVGRLWYVSRVKEVITGQLITLELKGLSDGINFQIPVRMYIPPEFPLVSL